MPISTTPGILLEINGAIVPLGPSDAQAAGSRRTGRKTAEGVDANASKAHLYDVAKRLDVKGRSKMGKKELVEAIKKANRRATSKARQS